LAQTSLKLKIFYERAIVSSIFTDDVFFGEFTIDFPLLKKIACRKRAIRRSFRVWSHVACHVKRL